MKALLPLSCLVAGFAVGLLIFSSFNLALSEEYAPYLSVAALVGLDTVFGGIRAGIEGRFQNDIFTSGFVLNTLLAAGLAWFGAQIGVDLALVAVLVLGSRIFLNLSLIRRHYLNTRALNRKRQLDEMSALPAAQAAISQKSEIGGSI